MCEIGVIGDDKGIERQMHLEREEFEELVREAVDSLPEKFGRKMKNVDVIIEDLPSGNLLSEMKIKVRYGLLGLYQGVPLSKRGVSYGNVLPDKITIFKKPIESRCRNKEEIKEAVRGVVVHEIGHHFGLGEADM